MFRSISLAFAFLSTLAEFDLLVEVDLERLRSLEEDEEEADTNTSIDESAAHVPYILFDETNDCSEEPETTDPCLQEVEDEKKNNGVRYIICPFFDGVFI